MWLKTTILFLLFAQKIWGYIEYVRTSGCESCALRLTCRHLDSIIAILEANFESIESNNETLPTAFPRMHPRLALNKRCSGVNHCSFILTKDCPGADTWGLGNLSIKYACIAERRVTKYCNKDIRLPAPETLGISQGFVHNPGYPRFYMGKQECRWKIRAPLLQRIKIIVFDTSLVGEPNLKECTDLLEISDKGQVLYSTCKQQEPPIEIISLEDTLDVILVPSKTESVLPRRGVLFYYTAIGCSTPSAPKDGYLVYRNDTAAEFSCCVGYVFADTGSRNRIIKCLGHKWDTMLPLPDCSGVTEGALSTDKSKRKYIKMVESATIQEIVIPSIIIVTLFVINSIVVFIIYKYKQKKSAEFSEEELGKLPVISKNENVA